MQIVTITLFVNSWTREKQLTVFKWCCSAATTDVHNGSTMAGKEADADSVATTADNDSVTDCR